MSQTESVHDLQPAAGATDALIGFVDALRYDALPDEVRHYAKRHILDSVGVIIAGAQTEVATRAEAMLASLRAEGPIPVPGRTRRCDLLDAAFLGGTAAHGMELDDGYRQGSVHPGCVVLPATLAAGYAAGANGKALMEAVIAGYESAIAVARACHPDLRQRGFHPTGTVGVLGAALAVGKLRGLTTEALRNALGIAASSAAGLFAFVNGGADIKRLHAGHASREGLQAALLAERGIQGPPGVIEARDGFMQAFAADRPDKARPVRVPPAAPFGITDCYVKPYPCCRHIQPAIEALIALLAAEGIATEAVESVEVETYAIAAEHAHTGWDDFASAQLSFPYLLALALRFRGIRLEHFADEVRCDPSLAALAHKCVIAAPAEIDRLYPRLRPARVRVRTAHGTFTRQVDEALGSRLVPLDDAGLREKFLGLVGPVLGRTTAERLARDALAIEAFDDLKPFVDAMTRPAA